MSALQSRLLLLTIAGAVCWWQGKLLLIGGTSSADRERRQGTIMVASVVTLVFAFNMLPPMGWIHTQWEMESFDGAAPAPFTLVGRQIEMMLFCWSVMITIWSFARSRFEPSDVLDAPPLPRNQTLLRALAGTGGAMLFYLLVRSADIRLLAWPLLVTAGLWAIGPLISRIARPPRPA